MSDLRTRIAEVQRAHMPIDYAGGIDCTCGDNFHPEHGGIDVAEPLWAAHVADAVIRELNLHVVTVGHFQTVIKGSYPTPLENDD